jgi:hypothetical protein
VGYREALARCSEFLGLEEFGGSDTIHENRTEGQRSFRLSRVSRLFPDSIKDRIDPGRRVRDSLLRMMDKWTVRTRPVVTDADIEAVSSMVAEDVAYYEQVFRASD